MSTVTVKRAETPREREGVYRLRYRVFVEQMGFEPDHADHESRLLVEPEDEYGYNFCALDDGEIVGAIRSNLKRDGPLQNEDLYDLEDFGPYYPDDLAMTTKFVTAPERGGSRIMRGLIDATYRHLRERNVQFDFMDCEPYLINSYEWLGYRRYKSNIHHPDTGTMTPMVFVLEDVEHLDRVQSPFQNLAREFDNHSDAPVFFREQFSEWEKTRVRRLRSSDELWEDFTRKLGSTLQNVVHLFEDLEDEEIKTFISKGNVITVDGGTVISQDGEDRHELYTVLSGQVAFERTNGDGPREIIRYDEGDTFGEVAYLADASRTGNIVARTDCELLVHDPRRLDKLRRVDPCLGAKVYRSLAEMVSLRLIKTSQLSRAH